ncbi:MAG: protoporphyrinogen oxidase [Bryobacteraceae bacterium]
MGRVVIIGGGISGLSTAYYLHKAGVSCQIVEARPRLGGVIQTERIEGCLVEAGPDSFIAAKPWAFELIRELGLEGEIIGSNDHLRKTYIWKSGRLVPLPDGLQLMIPTRVLPIVRSNLLGWRTKMRMGLEWFRKPKPVGDRSVAEFLEDHYGRESVDYLAEPLLAGVYGGEPEEMSAASVLARFVELEARYGSLTKGVLRERSPVQAPVFRTLRGGMSNLVAALEARIDPVVHGAADSIERSGSGYRVRVKGDWIDAARVVVACPAWQGASLIASLDGELAALLTAIPYRDALTMALGYEMRDLPRPLNGFGFLVPRRERRGLVACTWVNTKFSHRTPENLALLRCFLVPSQDSDETLVAAARQELKEIMGIEAAPKFSRVFRWPRSMAQYTVGHGVRMSRIEDRMKALPGLLLAGNGYYGIGIPDCVRMGREVATSVSQSLQRRV